MGFLKRPIRTGRKDSQGRTISVSDRAVEHTVTAPPPVGDALQAMPFGLDRFSNDPALADRRCFTPDEIGAAANRSSRAGVEQRAAYVDGYAAEVEAIHEARRVHGDDWETNVGSGGRRWRHPNLVEQPGRADMVVARELGRERARLVERFRSLPNLPGRVETVDAGTLVEREVVNFRRDRAGYVGVCAGTLKQVRFTADQVIGYQINQKDEG